MIVTVNASSAKRRAFYFMKESQNNSFGLVKFNEITWGSRNSKQTKALEIPLG